MAKTRANPHDLGARGLRLYKSIADGKTLDQVEIVLLVEACRAADRLESLNDLLAGREDVWVRIRIPRTDGDPLELLIDDALKEARMQAAALRQLLGHFSTAKGKAEEQGASGEVSELEKARQAREERRSSAARQKRT